MNGSTTANVAETAPYFEYLTRLRRELVVLPDKPDETPDNTLACLWSMAAGDPISLSQVGSSRLRLLDSSESELLGKLIEARLSGVPLAHLTGRQDFMGLILLSSAAALIPRKETELLGEAAVDKALETRTEDPLIVDICTGAGNLALGIAARVMRARVWGSDLSPEAVELARANAQFIGRTDVEFRCGDLLEPFNEPGFFEAVDVLVCNPPYISSARVDSMPNEIRRFEPRMAFDGGPFGINILRRLATKAPRLLKDGGWLLFEVGQGQGEHAWKLLQRETPFQCVEPLTDEEGNVRVITARKR